MDALRTLHLLMKQPLVDSLQPLHQIRPPLPPNLARMHARERHSSAAPSTLLSPTSFPSNWPEQWNLQWPEDPHSPSASPDGAQLRPRATSLDATLPPPAQQGSLDSLYLVC